MKNILTILIFISLASGCMSSIRNPEMTLEQKTSILTDRLSLATDIAKYKIDDPVTRNALIDSWIIVENSRYKSYISSLGASKQQLDAASDISLLFLSVAGTLAGGLQAKENLAAGASIITGSKIALDKHFFFNQTLPALISTMNNRRKQLLLRIVRGRAASIATYPTISASADLDEYARAGTLLDAIDAVQGHANEEQKVLDKQLRSILPATKAEIERSANINLSLAKLGKDTLSLDKINSILKAVGEKNFTYKTHQEAYQALSEAFGRDDGADISTWESALK